MSKKSEETPKMELIEGDSTSVGRVFNGWLILDWEGRQPRVVTTETGLGKNMGTNAFIVKYKITVKPPTIPTIEATVDMSEQKVMDIMVEHLI